MGRKKITIVGAGNVGATAAHWAAEKELGDIVLVDIIDGMPQGKALDLMESRPTEGFDVTITGTTGYDETAGSDLVIITSGLARNHGMSREDLMQHNKEIVSSVTKAVVAHSPHCIIIVVSNPLDIMTYVAKTVSGFPRNRIVGMAGVLDSARLKVFIAMELNVSVEDIQVLVLGGHGSRMVPLPRYATVGGIPLTRLLSVEKIEQLVNRTRHAGGEIVSLLKEGSAYYAPSASAVRMAEAILKDKKRVLPCCVYLEGEYGFTNICFGVPVKLGARGVEEVFEVPLTGDEQELIRESARDIEETIASLKL